MKNSSIKKKKVLIREVPILPLRLLPGLKKELEEKAAAISKETGAPMSVNKLVTGYIIMGLHYKKRES